MNIISINPINPIINPINPIEFIFNIRPSHKISISSNWWMLIISFATHTLLEWPSKFFRISAVLYSNQQTKLENADRIEPIPNSIK